MAFPVGTMKRAAVASDDVIANASTERSQGYINNYTKIKEIKAEREGSYKVSYEFKWIGGVAGNNFYTRIYKNGVAVGLEQYTTSTTYTVYEETLTGVVRGDLIQLYCHGSSSDGYEARGAVRNFKLSASMPLIPATITLD